MCDLWCVLYAPETVYVRLFEETLLALSAERARPRLYKFLVSGKRAKSCITLINKILPDAMVIRSRNRIKQYEGFGIIHHSYSNKEKPKFVMMLDGDDLVAMNRTMMMCEYIKLHNKAIITVVGKFTERPTDHDFSETVSEILPMAIDNGFIEGVDIRDEETDIYKVNTPFVSGEETSSMIIPYEIISAYLQSDVDLTNNYADTLFYKYLIDTDEVLLVVPSNPLYLYRVWDRGDYKISLHH